MRFERRVLNFISAAGLLIGAVSQAQMIDNTQAPNTAKAGINKSLLDEIGAGRGDVMTAGSSVYIINRDPFRSIRRGRQLFQRKFTRLQGQGANERTAWATSTRTLRSGLDCPTVARFVTVVRGVRRARRECRHPS